MTVLSISGARSKLVYDMWGKEYLYPDGTTRTIRKWTWRGYKIKEQICSIESSTASEGSIYYNKWRTISWKWERDL